MDDLISRQAAIDLINGWFKRIGLNGDICLDGLRQLPSATDKNVGTNEDCISRQAALDIFDDYNVAVENGQIEAYSRDRKRLCDLPPAQLGTNLTEKYARAVRNWLVNYQVKCADLAGRYTPYEVLGWIVSDWRKENGIW